MATSLEKKLYGNQLASAPTGSTTIPTACSAEGTMATMANHTRNAALVFGSTEHTATPSTTQATVNGSAAATPLSRMGTASAGPSSSSTALPTYTARITIMLASPSPVDTRHLPTNRSRREQPSATAFLNVPSFLSSANSTQTSSPASRNSEGSIVLAIAHSNTLDNSTIAHNTPVNRYSSRPCTMR